MQATLVDRLLIHNHIHSLTRRSREWCYLKRRSRQCIEMVLPNQVLPQTELKWQITQLTLGLNQNIWIVKAHHQFPTYND